ncbi:MAG: CRTAC1 family protein, partial [Planctomycetota bacterium]
MGHQRVTSSVAVIGLGVSSVCISTATSVAQIIPSTEEAVDRGLVYVMSTYPQATGYSGFGCGFSDLDGDGDQDAVLMGAEDGLVGIFENDGLGNFTARTDTGIPLMTEASGWAAADYDADGDLDLYLTQIEQPNVLMRHDGDFSFTDVSDFAGVAHPGESMSASWGDYDNDGLVDLYVTNYTNANPNTPSFNNELYRNLGNGQFEERGVKLGVDGPGYGFQAVWTDYDLDGDVDLYVSNDRGHLPPNFRSNQLWRNDGGTFTNVSESSGAGVALFSMGLAAGDFDGNGYPDLYVTNLASYDGGFNRLLLNQGDNTFLEYAEEAGVDQWISSWASIFYDFDNDGRQDLYVNNMFESNALHMRSDEFPCSNFAFAAAVHGNAGVSYGSAVADVDGDGDLDLVTNHLSSGSEARNVELFINHEGDTRDSVRFRIVGEQHNLNAIGASVRALVDGDWRCHEILASGNGYKGQNEMIAHFGLGSSVVDELLVMWPGGATRTLAGLPSNMLWTLYPSSRLGDADGDGEYTDADFQVMAGCYGGAVVPGCEMMDYDGDADVDDEDVAAFFDDFEAPMLDCDGNGTNDLIQILQAP